MTHIHIARAAVIGYAVQFRPRCSRRFHTGRVHYLVESRSTRANIVRLAIEESAAALSTPHIIEARVLALCDPETDPAGGEPFVVWAARVTRPYHSRRY